uniref:Uncharacterized protein n=2 Tax=Beta TaxID=3554 RepID=E6ZDV3_BETVM|nr:hypothetical protein LKY74_mgp020 [Beta vulgaris subsp. maritima]YP_004842184.1 hypothetical protein LKY79_mgp021 [Beta macrocarpa]CBL54128.1 hypothetical protein [Beta vulgaris subsp. maritima]CBX24989.1 hypothetical protein [Beta macrocarpa]CBX33219.1 hypothetical protein [Beta vulgaris subsp. maritima]CBX33226.1 hypothetical protein [Beta vulgaris subsp. maritima]CBX33313.1 hypothetical protein [Beta vulgaris subsp. maritima]
MEGEKKNFRSPSSSSRSSRAPGAPERDPERDKLVYSHYFNSVVKDVQAEVEGVLGRTPHFQTVSGLVQKQVPKVGADYKTLTPIKTQLGPDHPLVHFVITELLKRGF